MPLYLVYSFYTALMQFWWVPGVARYYNRSRVNSENIFRTYEKPKRDTAEAPDMIEKAY